MKQANSIWWLHARVKNQGSTKLLKTHSRFLCFRRSTQQITWQLQKTVCWYGRSHVRKRKAKAPTGVLFSGYLILGCSLLKHWETTDWSGLGGGEDTSVPSKPNIPHPRDCLSHLGQFAIRFPQAESELHRDTWPWYME